MYDITSSIERQKKTYVNALQNQDIERKSMLLHCCCAPCATYVLELLYPLYNITLFFYNPNIEPQSEYVRRKGEIDKLLVRNNLQDEIGVLDCGYDNEMFAKAVSNLRDEPEGGARCNICYELRLAKTAKQAVYGEYDIFATTLSISPYKDTLLLNQIGSKLSSDHNILYYVADFKENNGYIQSIELSKKYDLYRQNYCGCLSK
ncbi:MAG: epoxyqueuosine reductase QueH [Oscillospiraceae bacterium]|nr:epoxyqueuosine reductase QueH [Oscillospiraceae bacterium]